MVEIKNVRFVVYDQDGNGLDTSNKIPPGVELNLVTGEWTFEGGRFDLGQHIRVTEENEFLPGPVFGYDGTNRDHCNKRHSIMNDQIDHGYLVTV